jgi:hypothetical protein
LYKIPPGEKIIICYFDQFIYIEVFIKNDRQKRCSNNQRGADADGEVSRGFKTVFGTGAWGYRYQGSSEAGGDIAGPGR